jgi:hypothetical protein
MNVGKTTTIIFPSECGKLNVRSYVSASTPKIVAFKISSSGNVMVPSVNKFDFATKSIYFSSFVIPCIKS